MPGRRVITRWLVGVALVGAGLASAASAEARTVTLGSPLAGGSWGWTDSGAAGTISQTALPGATVTAPFDGTITSWKTYGAVQPMKLSVLRPSGEGTTKSVAEAATGPVTPTTEVVSFVADLRVEKGDSIGLTLNSGDFFAVRENAGAAFNSWTPPLPKGGVGKEPSDGAVGYELGFNATLESRAGCVVPNVKGKKLKAAKKKLGQAGCSLGKVKKPKAKKARKKAKYVKKQKPAAGTELDAGAKVNLTMGPKKK